MVLDAERVLVWLFNPLKDTTYDKMDSTIETGIWTNRNAKIIHMVNFVSFCSCIRPFAICGCDINSFLHWFDFLIVNISLTPTKNTHINGNTWTGIFQPMFWNRKRVFSRSPTHPLAVVIHVSTVTFSGKNNDGHFLLVQTC